MTNISQCRVGECWIGKVGRVKILAVCGETFAVSANNVEEDHVYGWYTFKEAEHWTRVEEDEHDDEKKGVWMDEDGRYRDSFVIKSAHEDEPFKFAPNAKLLLDGHEYTIVQVREAVKKLNEF